MAYYSGIANSPASLRDSILANLATSGWTVSGVQFYKGSITGTFENILTTNDHLDLVAKFSYRDPVTGTIGPTTNFPIGFGFGSFTVFPISFEMFVFDDPLECHIVINYNTEFYQIWSFGVTHVNNPDGYPWVSGAYQRSGSSITVYNAMGVQIYGTNVVTLGSTGYLHPGMLIPSSSSGVVATRVFATIGSNSSNWLSWNSNSIEGSSLFSVYLCGTPTNQNANNLLCPAIGTYSVNSNYHIYLVADITHARLTRNDNILPGEIIEFGEDRWKVFPVFRRNTAARNGSLSFVDHSGTLAAAFKYEGP